MSYTAPILQKDPRFATVFRTYLCLFCSHTATHASFLTPTALATITGARHRRKHRTLFAALCTAHFVKYGTHPPGLGRSQVLMPSYIPQSAHTQGRKVTAL